MWNPNLVTTTVAADSQDEDESWEVKAFAEDTGNVMGTTWPPRSYTCTFCRREFRSAQALGGHMNVHRRDRARLHQAQANYSQNPNLYSPPSSSSSSNLLIPTQELSSDNGGLCLLLSLPNSNAIFKPPSSHLLPITPHHHHHNTDNFMNYPAVVDPQFSFNYSFSNSSNNEASTSIDHKSNKKINDLAVEGIDLELRLGCSSSAS